MFIVCPLRIEELLVGGVGGGGGGGANLWWVGVGRWGRGGGGGGIQGALTVILEGGGGATLVAVVIVLFVLEVGGDGGFAIGGLSIRFVGLGWVSFKQSWDWWREDGVGASTGGDLGNRILCALDTLPPVVKFNFLGGGDGLCNADEDVEGGFGARVGFPNPLDTSVFELI